MARDKPPVSRESVEHQDQSIKVRKTELYEARSEAPIAPVARKPFTEYLRTTPARPMPKGWRKALWVIGAVVALLFLAAIITVGRHRAPRRLSARPGAIELRGASHESITRFSANQG